MFRLAQEQQNFQRADPPSSESIVSAQLPRDSSSVSTPANEEGERKSLVRYLQRSLSSRSNHGSHTYGSTMLEAQDLEEDYPDDLTVNTQNTQNSSSSRRFRGMFQKKPKEPKEPKDKKKSMKKRIKRFAKWITGRKNKKDLTSESEAFFPKTTMQDFSTASFSGVPDDLSVTSDFVTGGQLRAQVRRYRARRHDDWDSRSVGNFSVFSQESADRDELILQRAAMVRSNSEKILRSTARSASVRKLRIKNLETSSVCSSSSAPRPLPYVPPHAADMKPEDTYRAELRPSLSQRSVLSQRSFSQEIQLPSYNSIYNAGTSPASTKNTPAKSILKTDSPAKGNSSRNLGHGSYSNESEGFEVTYELSKRDDDEEDITNEFRPVKQTGAFEPIVAVRDRWSPAPSPTNEQLASMQAPKLPPRPVDDDDDDASLTMRAPTALSLTSTVSSDESKEDYFEETRSMQDDDAISYVSQALSEVRSVVEALLRRENKSGRVRFGNVQVREYERALGDNPSCSSGPPISIGWCYNMSRDLHIDDYERVRPARRNKRQFYLSAAKRNNFLTEWDVSSEEMHQARREVTYIQYCREKAILNMKRKGEAMVDAQDVALASPSHKPASIVPIGSA